MNILDSVPVNKKLMAGIGLVLLLTAALGIVAYTQATTVNTAATMLKHSTAINGLIGEMRQQEENFQVREDQKSIDDNAAKIDEITAHLAAVTPLATSKEKASIAEVETSIAAYKVAFSELVKETRATHVYENACATDAQVVENSVNAATYLDAVTTNALLLDIAVIRNAEKNFVTYGNERYVADTTNGIHTFETAISASELTASDKSAIMAESGAYQATFAKLVDSKDQVHASVAVTGPLVADGMAARSAANKVAESAAARKDAAAASSKTAVPVFVILAIIHGIVVANIMLTNPSGRDMVGANKIRGRDLGYALKVSLYNELGIARSKR